MAASAPVLVSVMVCVTPPALEWIVTVGFIEVSVWMRGYLPRPFCAPLVFPERLAMYWFVIVPLFFIQAALIAKFDGEFVVML